MNTAFSLETSDEYFNERRLRKRIQQCMGEIRNEFKILFGKSEKANWKTLTYGGRYCDLTETGWEGVY
jgi:hypothetical protein